MSEELKPCPFCGSTNGASLDAWRHCECGAVSLLSKWNSRPIEDALRARVEALLPLAKLGLETLARGHDLAVELGLLELAEGADPDKAKSWAQYRACYTETDLARRGREAVEGEG